MSERDAIKITLQCKRHPTYKAKRPSGCVACAAIYDLVLRAAYLPIADLSVILVPEGRR